MTPSCSCIGEKVKSAPLAKGNTNTWLAVHSLCAGLAREGQMLHGWPCQWQQHASPHGAGNAISAAHNFRAAWGGGWSWAQPTPPALTASAAQPTDPGLLSRLTDTRANMAFLRGLKKLQPHCAQPLLKSRPAPPEGICMGFQAASLPDTA